MFVLKTKTKKITILILLTVVCLTLQTLSGKFSQIHDIPVNGILLSFQFLVYLLMLKVDYRYGRIFSVACMLSTILNILIVIAHLKKLQPFPGLCSTIIYLITIIILSYQFQNRDKEIITDYVTGVLNERGLYRRINSKIEYKKHFKLYGLGINNFVAITANYGHEFCETLLKKFADDLSSNFDKKDIALLEGNKFFLLVDYNETDAEEKLKNFITDKILVEYKDNLIEAYINLSIGYACYPDDAENADELIKNADIAMYDADKNKLREICHYKPVMEQQIIRRMDIEKVLKSALKNEYFHLVFQPQYVLNGKKLRGFETLLRLETPMGLSYSPAEFIPVAEKSDLILKIDDYVIIHAMKEFKDIITTQNKDLIISVNVSAKNIANPEFPDKILSYIKETDFPPQNLEIEITEYCLVQSIDQAVANIKKLRQNEIKIALDDFGTGYTSLSYLAKLPVNLLKIDKSLIDDIETDSKILEFVNTVISLGHLMNCEVISEGVETENQLSLLKEKNCDLIQGYVWGKPVMYEDAQILALTN